MCTARYPGFESLSLLIRFGTLRGFQASGQRATASEAGLRAAVAALGGGGAAKGAGIGAAKLALRPPLWRLGGRAAKEARAPGKEQAPTAMNAGVVLK